MIQCERTPSEWFAEAVRCYNEQHQGCAWCGGAHRVFQSQRGTQQEFYCIGCDFRAVHDQTNDRYYSYPGDKRAGRKPLTMHGV